jgi:uncharacterized membrane protein YidH (DUF202 family)
MPIAGHRTLHGAAMIERYSDHAANERTFLAWVRTAIAVMAFGFLVEKFDLFLEIAANSAGVRAPAGGQFLANVAGLLLIALGAATMVLAIVRFRKTSRHRQRRAPPGDGRANGRGARGASRRAWRRAVCLFVLYGDQPVLMMSDPTAFRKK